MPLYPKLLALPAEPAIVDAALWDLLQAETVPDFDGALCFPGDRPGRTLAVCDSQFEDLDTLAGQLSTTVAAPVLAIAMVDDAAWRYALAVDGAILDRFCTDPEFQESWPGNAETLAARWPDVTPAALAPYLVDHAALTPEDLAEPTHPDDEFPRGDAWQFCDFLRRLGLHYPGPDDLPYDPDWQADE